MTTIASRLTALIAGLAAAIVSTGCLAPATAQSPLKELRARQAEERALASEAAYTSNVCGTRISSRIDWNRSESWPDNRSIADACDDALGAIEAICRSDQSRVSGKISSFTCAGDGAGPSLSGSTLTFGASPNGSGFGETRSYLEGRL